MNSETSISICVRCGAGAPTERNEKVKMVVFKDCASCEQKDRNSSSVPDIKDQCAACGKSGKDNNLKVCTACKMVKYCNRECQIAHRSAHKKECKKRALENENGVDNLADNMKKVSISDDILFQEPPSKEDCAICMLPVPYTGGLCGVKVTYQPCCGKLVCEGCTFASAWSGLENASEIIGKEGVFYCIILFASPLAALKHVIVTKSAASIPLPFTFACLLNCMTWTVVRWWKIQPSDFNIYFPNMMGLACAVAHLVLKGIYGNSPTKDLPK